MEIKFTNKEAEGFFYNALCNAVSTGYMAGYGLAFDYDNKAYHKAGKTLKEQGKKDVCLEDVWMEILREGGKLTFVDQEGNGEYTKDVTMKEVHERMPKVPIDHLIDMINETDDAVTADVVLQTIFFEDVIFS